MLHSADDRRVQAFFKPCGIPLTQIKMTGIFAIHTASSALMIILLNTARMMSAVSESSAQGRIESSIPHLGFEMQFIDSILV